MTRPVRRTPARATFTLVVALVAGVAGARIAHAQRPAPASPTAPSASRPMTRAAGTFEVTLTPQPADAYADGAMLGRMTIDKRFHGDLEATSTGQMLSAMTPVKGSAGYVAIERVTGTLAGRRGSFVLQHLGTMERGAQRLVVSVVPDSGTEGLAGITGTMTIDVSGGRHGYEFTYALPDAR